MKSGVALSEEKKLYPSSLAEDKKLRDSGGKLTERSSSEDTKKSVTYPEFISVAQKTGGENDSDDDD
jgi:hypothetical protein